MKPPTQTDVRQFDSAKILNHPERIYEWLETGNTKPITYELDLTNKCNSECPYCFGFLNRKNNCGSLDKKFVVKILNQIKNFGGKAVTFTGGGEPLLNSNIADSIAAAKELGLDVGIITNGILLKKEISEIILKNAVWIRISLDAASPEIYKKTHGLGSDFFYKVCENIKAITSLKKRIISSTTVGIGFLTFEDSIRDIVKFAKLGKELGVDYSQYRPLLNSFKAEKINYKQNYSKVVFNKIREAMRFSTSNYKVLYSKHKYDTIQLEKNLRNYQECYGHHFAAVIAADKKMYLCCHLRGVKKYCLGNLKIQTLKQIWTGAFRKKIYENINFKDCPFLCRCDSFNTILWNIRKPKVHINFL
ncbi:MAG TPA: radical SAM protein [bacterium]|nr:radical SAM protein [bacterium]HPN29747.1 radical SAM protein [bacterium]